MSKAQTEPEEPYKVLKEKLFRKPKQTKKLEQ